MADEKIIELLSRYLDGDLDADETRQIETRLESKPALQNELEAMRQIRRSVATLAAADTVPPELDSVIDPLLRGRPETVGARSWVRWLATAAAVVLGTTVVIEVNRRNSGPNIEHFAKATKERQQAESEDRFTLAPLPTSSVPEEERPLGASDRLLASPAPEVELDDPPPLEVLGPLEEEDRASAIDDIAEFNRSQPVTEMSAVAADTPSEKGGDEQPAPSGAKMRQAPRTEDKLESQEAGRGEALQSWNAAPSMGRGQLFVFIDGRSAWREFIPSATCKPGRYAVRIVVADGAVHEARPVGGAASSSPSQRLCAANLILDLEIEEVADGEYPAEVVVEPRGVQR
jgi:hypothetical protein